MNNDDNFSLTLVCLLKGRAGKRLFERASHERVDISDYQSPPDDPASVAAVTHMARYLLDKLPPLHRRDFLVLGLPKSTQGAEHRHQAMVAREKGQRERTEGREKLTGLSSTEVERSVHEIWKNQRRVSLAVGEHESEAYKEDVLAAIVREWKPSDLSESKVEPLLSQPSAPAPIPGPPRPLASRVRQAISDLFLHHNRR